MTRTVKKEAEKMEKEEQGRSTLHRGKGDEEMETYENRKRRRRRG